MNNKNKILKNKIRIIISSYRNGSPIGPMNTARLYSKALCESSEISIQEVLIICDKNSNIDLVKQDYNFAKNLKIIESKSKLPILLRPLFEKNIRSEINRIYNNDDIVVAIWYPAIVLNLTPSMLKKTIVVMMDSQVGLIFSTLTNFNWIKYIGNLSRLLIYSFLEFYIGIYARTIAFVSEDDLKLFPRKNLSRVIYPKLPIDNYFKKLSFGVFPAIILIPRPDLQLLSEFLDKIPNVNCTNIVVLYNGQLDSNISQRVTHIKFVNNYLDFYTSGGLVVLLDKGGAGVTNRVLAVSSLGLPFIGTISSLRGHRYEFPNCLLASDDIEQLALKAVSSLSFINAEFNDDLRNYVNAHFYKNACLPIINSI
jgi:hypothetical protein